MCSTLFDFNRRRLTPQPVKIRADIDCSCFGYEGIDAVKEALLAGEQCSTEDVQIKVFYFNVQYPLTLHALDSIDCTTPLRVEHYVY